MQEGLRKAEPRKPESAANVIDLASIMTCQRNIHSQLLVPRTRRPTDKGIPLPAAMRGIEDERFADLIA
ncbi:MAG: hypothetical protein Hens2KO_04400 [Henriciella sp.]